MPFREKQVDPCEVQDSQGDIVRSCLKKKENKQIEKPKTEKAEEEAWGQYASDVSDGGHRTGIGRWPLRGS